MAVSAAVAGNAAAQQFIEEVVVTATKREESLQDVPLAITAFTTEEIEKRNFDSFQDYVKFVPGMSFAKRQPGGTSIVFRGVASSGLQYGARASSCVYLDEQPITASGQNPDPRLIDVQRLEALRGPQGTLYGDSCQSGTLRILTNRPDPAAFDSWVEASGNKVDGGDAGYDVSGMINIPIGANLAVRLTGFRTEEAGYIDNIFAPTPGGTSDNAAFVENNVNSATYTGGRAAVRWEPTDALRLDASAIFQDSESDGAGDVTRVAGDLEQIRWGNERSDDEWYQIGATISANLAWADAVVTGAYFNRDIHYNQDAVDYQFFNFQETVDRTEASVWTGVPPKLQYDFNGDPVGGFAINDQERDSWTIEARLSTSADSDSRWRGLVGFFYNKTDNFTFFQSGNDNLPGSGAFFYLNYLAYYERYDVNAPVFRGPAQAWPLGPNTNNWYFALYDSTIDQTAIFGEISFDFTDNLIITAGGRWYRVEEDRHTILGAAMQSDFPDVNTDLVFDDSRASSAESGFLPKAGIEYWATEDKMVYFTFSEGFRSGGGNAARRDSIFARQFKQYRSDTLLNYEFGAKTTWLDGQLQINASAYRMKWDDIQIQIEDPTLNGNGGPIFQLGFINFPEAEINGFEVEAQWVPTASWQLGGSVSYNDATISKTATFQVQGNIDPDNDEFTARKGTRLPITPDWKLNLFAEYSFETEIFGAVPYVRFDYSHTGESINSLGGFEAVVGGFAPSTQEPYDIGDLKLGLDAETWSATLFMDNIWDERADQYISNRWAIQRVSINPPRTFGLTFRKRFK
jgi:outer membrane receptor protein involved in Fe transport